MAFLDRLHKIAVAAGGATKAVIGFTLGLPAASFRKDEYDSFVGDIYGNIVASGKDTLAATIGPQGVGGQIFGAIPEPLRSPVRTVTEPITSGLETGYREAIAEPISTFFTTVAIADEYGTFSPSKAYRIAQHRSPGQSLAVAFDGLNPLDEAEVAKFLATDKGKIISGMGDAILRVGADPTVILGKVAKGTRAATLAQKITPENLPQLLNSPKVAQFNDAISALKREHGENAAAVIRQRFFPDHDSGALISTVLSEAKTPKHQWLATRALMGDAEALASLRADRSVLHEQIASLNRQADQLGPIKATTPPSGQGTLFGTTDIGIPGDVAALRDELDIYYKWDTRLARVQRGFGAIKEAPRVSKMGATRTAITRSDFYQNTSLGRSLETIFHMNAHPVANLSDTRSDIQLNRLLDEAGLPQDLKDTFRTEYMAAPDDASRRNIMVAAETNSIAYIAKKAGIPEEELITILNDIAKNKGEAQNLLDQRVFNDDGSSVLTHQNEQGEWVETFFPPWATQEATLLPLINMRELSAAATKYGEYRARFGVLGVPREVANTFTRIWKPAVLLRPAWPIRVVGDEQFRIIAKIGALSHLDNLQTGLRDYTTDFLSATRERGIQNVVGRSNRDVRQSFAVREFNYNGYDMEGVFGTPDDIRRHTRELASAAESWHAMTGQAEGHYLREMRKAGQNFKSVTPDSPDYPALYNWAADHLRQQPIARQLLEGKSVDEVIDFLHSTPEGSDILRANTIRSHNARNWVEEIEREVDRYTAGNDELRALVLSGKASGQGGVTFRTAKGSTYTVHPDGTTTRNKAARPEHPNDSGVKDRSARTVYLSEQDASRLATPQGEWRYIEDNGKLTLASRTSKDKPWGAAPSQRDISFSTTPSQGSIPVELWDKQPTTTGGAAFRKVHFGNPITELMQETSGSLYDDLIRLVPDESLRPVAHGEALLQATNQGYIARTIAQTVERTFDKLGRLPTDTFSRNPFMGHMYRSEVKRQLDLIGDNPIDNTLKRQIEDNARGYALNETQKLLYDLAEQSRFGEILGFLSPFYNAWQEVITRWTGLAIENPVFAARARLVWRAPEKMGLVTDENGREIASGQVYSDDETSPNYRGKDRILHIPLPDFVTDIPGMKRALGPKQEIAFNKKSFNLVLQGWPGAGPIASIPVNQIVKDRPELADNAFVEKVLPFGPTHNLPDMILPASAKYFLSASDQDAKYANTLMRIYNDRIVEWELAGRPGGIENRPKYEDAKKEADAFTVLRGFSAMIAPAAPIWQSPYQTYIDSFRQAQARYSQDKLSLSDEHGNARTPDEWFLDTHGKEYFQLTQAVSKSVNGVPPTLDAWLSSKENADLIQEFPELGGLIVGADGGGAFNSAVYNAQKNTSLAPGSSKNQREPIPFDEASIGPERRLGWIEYRRSMDLIEATRIQRGLPNLQVAAAQDLAAIKSALTKYLGDKYPAWKDDFNQTDKGKWEKKINALATISSDPRMADREDMKGIREYLAARSMMNKALEDRSKSGGAKTLTASSNTDLASTWQNITGYLVEKNLAFSDVFYRHLENDPLGL